MRTCKFSWLAICAVCCTERVIADVTLYSVKAENQTGLTEILSASVVGVSPIDVINGVTDYAVTEVQSLLIDEDASATFTIFATPTTTSYDIMRGSTFLANTIFETITSLPPTATALLFGFDACAQSSGVVQSSGLQVQCFEFITESNLGASTEEAATIGFSGELIPIFTITETTVNPTFDNPIGSAPTITSAPRANPNPASTTPARPPATNSASNMKGRHQKATFCVGFLVALVCSLNFFVV
ncbi:hypothetical protein CPB84DRAFT_1777345 [Gymnopilus junonius]|uniref:Uncharacterized protein n=1 Tax=Gymnopilus junonius TaxID=109634 RepID=A0A9P5TMH7_GYMJU|nr:hypothetical protein CPB84DRAFT_1777345 [Gymnopilus junonius]